MGYLKGQYMCQDCGCSITDHHHHEHEHTHSHDSSTHQAAHETLHHNPQLNDVTVGNGIVYISGSGSDTIYKIEGDEIDEVAKDTLGRLNGLLYQKEGIYYAASASHCFGLYNMDSQTFKTLVPDIGHGDGVIRLDNEDFIISSWQGQIFYIDSDNWTKTLLLDTRDESINAADIDYIPATRTLLVPTFFDNRVVAYKVNYE